MESVTVGLDIGSSAVRAAEIHVARDGRRQLRRYAQVGLPHGYVVDGEINNVPGVAEAVRRLWTEGGFTSTEVVLGVSGPRVFVRQADVPPLSAEDLRSSLRFDAQEMVPVPMDEASFDFSVLGSDPAEPGSGKRTQRILIVAAHSELLTSYVTTLGEAGLTPTVMDASPLALLRSVPPVGAGDQDGVDVVVSIGAELTTVAVTEKGVPHFIRSLTLGGGKLTERIANTMHVELAVAERLKRGAVAPDAPQLSQARKAMSSELREMAEEVRATIDFFLAQSPGAGIRRIVLTGGASQTEGLGAHIGGNLPAPVVRLNPLAGLDVSSLGYDEPTMALVEAGSATAVGLALWPTEAPLIRLNLLPEEVAAARRSRRIVTFAGIGVAAVAGVLAAVTAGQVVAVHSANGRVHQAQGQMSSLTAQVSHLQSMTAVHGQAEARATMVRSALQGDVDWVRVLGQLASVMPADLNLTTFAGARTAATGGSGSSSGASAVPGSLTLSVKGSGGLPAAAAWLEGLQSDPDLSDPWIAGLNVQPNGDTISFSSTANLTPESDSNRAKEVQG